MGVAKDVQAVFRGGGAVYVPCGRVQDGVDHALRRFEAVVGDLDGEMDGLERGGIWVRDDLAQGSLARFGEARGLAGSLDLGLRGDGVAGRTVAGGGG